jgi:hypothetical protein
MLALTAATTAQAGEYPKHWTWEKEKVHRYPNGSSRPTWMPKIWFAIAACEQPYGSGVRWDAYSSGYEGAFGFAHSSWDAFKLPGYPDSANQASAWQQYQVALQIYHRYGFSGWGCYTGGGYRYHM